MARRLSQRAAQFDAKPKQELDFYASATLLYLSEKPYTQQPQLWQSESDINQKKANQK